MTNEYERCPRCGTPLRIIDHKYMKVLQKEVDILETCPVCKAREEKEKKAFEEKKAKIERKRLLERLNRTNIGRKYFGLEFDKMEKISPSFTNALNRCKKYCDVAEICRAKGLGIYLYGDNGRGKTALTACMIKELIKKEYSCYSTNLVELVDTLIKGRKELQEIKETDFLFLDDIGTEKFIKKEDSSWIADKLFEIVTYRDKEQLPTIFTSNKQISDLLKIGMFKKTVERISYLATVKMEIKTDKSYRFKEREEQKVPF